jgi:hypothetical protein
MRFKQLFFPWVYKLSSLGRKCLKSSKNALKNDFYDNTVIWILKISLFWRDKIYSGFS